MYNGTKKRIDVNGEQATNVRNGIETITNEKTMDTDFSDMDPLITNMIEPVVKKGLTKYKPHGKEFYKLVEIRNQIGW